MTADLLRELEQLQEAGEAVIEAWDAMDGTDASRGALMGAFGALRLALANAASDEERDA
jgi:aminoglycoside phosphotransferase (APT) family kinase protein